MTDSVKIRIDAILADLGRVVTLWNGVERGLRYLLLAITGFNVPERILTVHMGSNALCDALRILANDYLKNDEQGLVLHAIRYFEIAREYRNYIVHSATQTFGASSDGGASVFMYSLSQSARQRYVTHREEIDSDKLAPTIAMIRELSDYINQLYAHFSVREALTPSAIEPRGPLPEKPELPAKLKKPIQYLMDAVSSPPSSQE